MSVLEMWIAFYVMCGLIFLGNVIYESRRK